MESINILFFKNIWHYKGILKKFAKNFKFPHLGKSKKHPRPAKIGLPILKMASSVLNVWSSNFQRMFSKGWSFVLYLAPFEFFSFSLKIWRKKTSNCCSAVGKWNEPGSQPSGNVPTPIEIVYGIFVLRGFGMSKPFEKNYIFTTPVSKNGKKSKLRHIFVSIVRKRKEARFDQVSVSKTKNKKRWRTGSGEGRVSLAKKLLHHKLVSISSRKDLNLVRNCF